METTNQNIKYPYIPEGRSILYVPENNIYILKAKEVALKESTDRQISTGVVVVNPQGEIVITAANQSALRNKFLLDTHKKWCIRKLFKVKSGQKYWLCPGCANHEYHGESFAMKKARKSHLDVSGCDLYLWGHFWCCEPCWNAMISLGIKDVYLLEKSEILFNKDNPNNIIGKQFQ